MDQFKEIISEMGFRELSKAHWILGWEMICRVWWVYVIILTIIVGVVLAEVIDVRRGKK